MYGTVARMRVKPGAEERMRALMAEYEALRIPGLKGQVVYRSDRDPAEYVMAVVFESKDAYVANADTPEQHRRFLRYRELLTADPEWTDGEIVYTNL